MKKQSTITLEITAEYDPGEDKLPPQDAFVVAFDKHNCKITSAAIKKGCAELKIPAQFAGQSIRLFHAPIQFGLTDDSSITRLQRYQAFEKRFYVDSSLRHLHYKFPKLDLTRWLKACCRVRGQVLMRIRMPSGKVRTAPICNARLQIFEVDHTLPMIIKALPDHLIYRLRDDWKDAIQNPLALADIRPELAVMGEGLRQALRYQGGPQKNLLENSPRASKKVRAQAELRQLIEPIFNLKSAAPLRAALINNLTLLRPYLCYFYWLPLHDLDLLKTIDINEDGSFDTHINYPCFGDKPDLYFKVQQDCHEDGWLTIYAPSIHCNTYWNYCCGTEVNIQVSHPQASPGLSLTPCVFPYDTNDPAVMGESQDMPAGYETPANFTVANAALMHTGDVLLMREADYNPAVAPTLSWNPNNETVAEFSAPVPNVTQSMWCCGHAFLADGRLLAMGGAGNSMNTAVTAAWTYEPHSKVWTQDTDMHFKRWYPTGVPLPDGRVLTVSGVSGHVEGHGPTHVPELEIYDPDAAPADRWSVISGADRVFEGTYPGLHLLPSGDVVFTRTGWREHTGDPIDKSAILHLTGSPAGASGFWGDEYTMNCPRRREGMSVIILREHTEGPAAEDAADPEPLTTPIPYAQIIVFGGDASNGSPCRTLVEKIDLPPVSGTPQWDQIESLVNGRLNLNVVLLPDGTVLICGGGASNIPCEIYNPDTNEMIEVAPLKRARGYHSQALLLPNGKVFITGGSAGGENEIELYQPPYLFRGPRPAYSIANSHFHHGDHFSIHSADACRIKKIGLMRPSAVTHHTDPEQRYIMLNFERVGNCELKIDAPSSGAIAPPGHYMLFIVDDCGIPSEAEFIDLH